MKIILNCIRCGRAFVALGTHVARVCIGCRSSLFQPVQPGCEPPTYTAPSGPTDIATDQRFEPGDNDATTPHSAAWLGIAPETTPGTPVEPQQAPEASQARQEEPEVVPAPFTPIQMMELVELQRRIKRNVCTEWPGVHGVTARYMVVFGSWEDEFWDTFKRYYRYRSTDGEATV